MIFLSNLKFQLRNSPLQIEHVLLQVCLLRFKRCYLTLQLVVFILLSCVALLHLLFSPKTITFKNYHLSTSLARFFLMSPAFLLSTSSRVSFSERKVQISFLQKFSSSFMPVIVSQKELKRREDTSKALILPLRVAEWAPEFIPWLFITDSFSTKLLNTQKYLSSA